MAIVPYEQAAAPEVAPDTRVPDDYQHEQATPQEAGGLIAQGLERGGEGVEKASQNLFDMAQFQGRVNVDDQVNHFITRHDQILYGDPTKQSLGPDGKPVADTGFYGLQGRAASDQREGTLKSIDDLRKEGRANLKSPQEQFLYDEQTRRIYADTVQRVGLHTDQQWKSWAGTVNANGSDLALAAIARNPDDLNEFQHQTKDLIDFRVKQAQIKYGDDPTITQQTVDNAKADAVAARLRAIAVKNPSQALSLLDGYKNTTAVIEGRTGQSYYDLLAGEFRNRAAQQDGITLQRKAMSETYGNQPPATPASVTLPQLSGAILNQESGNRDVVPASITGAVGPGQIEPATFRQYARPGETIGNPSDNRAVSARILADYYQKFGGDPYRVAVAYFSGPNNVAPPGSPTPWVQNRADPTGKTVAGYVSDVAARLGVAPGSPYAAEASAERQIMMSDASEDVKQHALAENARFFREAQIATEGDAKAKKDANDSAMNGYVSSMMKDGLATPAMIQQIAADGHLTPESKENLQRFATQDFGLENTMQFGQAYPELYKRIFLPPDDPQRISDANQILIAASPGGGLTARGGAQLISVFNASRKDPDQAAVNQAKSGLINYAKSKLSFDQEMLFPGVKPLSDPKGVQVFDAQFVPKFESAYAAWMKAGKNPWEFLTQENVDKLMTGLRSKNQMAMDRIAAQGDVTGDKIPEAAVPPPPAGIEPATWQGIMAARPVAPNGRPVDPGNWAKAINIVRTDPTPENIAYFNKTFRDVDAADLLKKFAPVAAKEAPAVQPAPSVPQPVPVAPVARPFTDSETEDPDLATAREATLAARQRGQETRANLVQ